MVFERVLGCMLKDPHNEWGHRFSRPSRRAVSIGVYTPMQRASPTENLGLGLGLGLASTPSLAGCTGWIPRALVMPGPHIHKKKKDRYGTTPKRTVMGPEWTTPFQKNISFCIFWLW